MAKQRVIGSAGIEVRATGEKIAEDVRKIKQATRAQLEEVQKSLTKIRPNIETQLLKKTIAEIKTMQIALQRQYEQKLRLNADYGSIQRTRQALDTVKDALRNVEVEKDNLNKTGSFDLGKVIAFGSVVAATKLIYDFGKEAVIASTKLEVLRDNFSGGEDDIELFRKATARTVADADLLELSNQASALGISLEQQVLLFSLAEDAGDAMGKDVSAGMEKIIAASEGMGRGLKSLGIQTKVYEQFVKEGAAAHGTTIEKLDAETQKQVRLEAIIRASGITIADVNKKTQDNADKVESASISWDKLKTSIGKLTTGPVVALLDKITKAAEGWNVILGGQSTNISGGNKRQETFYESIKDLTAEQLKAESSKIKLLQDQQKEIMITHGVMTEEFKTAYGIANAYQEQLDVIKDIDKWKSKKTSGDGGTITDPEEAKRRAAEKLELEKKFYDGVKFLSANFIDYKLKETEKEIEEMKKAGLKELDFEAYKTTKKKQLFDEYLKYISDKTGFTFDKNGQISNGKEAIPLEFMSKSKLKGAKGEPRPNTDFGTDSQILEDWVNQSEASRMAFDTMFNAFYEGLSQIKIRTKESASSIEKTFAGMANIVIAEIERILLKWAALNIISLIATGGMSVGLGSVIGLNRTTSGTGNDIATNLSAPISMSYQNSFSNTSSFNDRNIVQKLERLNDSVQSLTIATIKGRGMNDRANSNDLLKQISIMVAQQQNNFSADNFKVSRG